MSYSYLIVPFLVFVVLQLGIIKWYFFENSKEVSKLKSKPIFSSRFGWFSYGVIAPIFLLILSFLVTVFITKSSIVFIAIYLVGFFLYNFIALPKDIRFSHFLEDKIVIVKPRVFSKNLVSNILVKDIENVVIVRGTGNNLNSYYAINFSVNSQKHSIKLKNIAENIYPEDFKRYFLTRNIEVYVKKVGERVSSTVTEVWKD